MPSSNEIKFVPGDVKADATQLVADIVNHQGREGHLNSATGQTLLSELPLRYTGRNRRYVTAVAGLTQWALDGSVRRDGSPYVRHPSRAAHRVKDDKGSLREVVIALTHDNQEVPREEGRRTKAAYRWELAKRLKGFPIRAIGLVLANEAHDKNNRHGKPKSDKRFVSGITHLGSWKARGYDVADSARGDFAQLTTRVESGNQEEIQAGARTIIKSAKKVLETLPHIKRRRDARTMNHLQVTLAANEIIREKYAQKPAQGGGLAEAVA